MAIIARYFTQNSSFRSQLCVKFSANDKYVVLNLVFDNIRATTGAISEAAELLVMYNALTIRSKLCEPRIWITQELLSLKL